MDDPVEAVFFDMDETLVQHTSDAYEILTEMHQRHAEALAPVEAQPFIRTLSGKANDMWQMMFDGVLPGEVARPYTFINTLRSLKLNDRLAQTLLHEFEERMITSSRVAPDAKEVIAELRRADIPVGMVTNGYTAIQSRKAEYHGLLDAVDFVLISESVGAHKPDPRIFHEALTRAGASAERSVFVGDNLRADVGGALNVGMIAVHYNPRIDDSDDGLAPPPSPNDPVPTHTISRLMGVLPIAGVV